MEEKKIKRSYKMSNEKWKDMPIEEVELHSMQSLIFNEIMKLPNIPEDYQKYSLRQLYQMNKEYIKSEKGRNR